MSESETVTVAMMEDNIEKGCVRILEDSMRILCWNETPADKERLFLVGLRKMIEFANRELEAKGGGDSQKPTMHDLLPPVEEVAETLLGGQGFMFP